jgi:hypothetical protein
MGDERLDLYFDPLRVGAVTPVGEDFPNLGGYITYDPSLAKPPSAVVARLARFIALNRESTRLEDLEDESGIPQGADAVNSALETHYIDYVESGDWRLVDGRGRERPILCPIFHENEEIVWRWAAGRG